jgi:hypothetical protein
MDLQVQMVLDLQIVRSTTSCVSKFVGLFSSPTILCTPCHKLLSYKYTSNKYSAPLQNTLNTVLLDIHTCIKWKIKFTCSFMWAASFTLILQNQVHMQLQINFAHLHIHLSFLVSLLNQCQYIYEMVHFSTPLPPVTKIFLTSKNKHCSTLQEMLTQHKTRETWEDAVSRLYGLRWFAHHIFWMFCISTFCKLHVCPEFLYVYKENCLYVFPRRNWLEEH